MIVIMLSVTMLIVAMPSIIMQNNDTHQRVKMWHFLQHKYFAECHNLAFIQRVNILDCHYASVIIPVVAMLSVIMQNNDTLQRSKKIALFIR
jgi:hypothetical protein